MLRLNESPEQIIEEFDVDACAVFYDRKDVYGIDRSVRALSNRVNMVDLSYRSWSYEKRLLKYAKRGFAIGVPGLRREDIELREYLDDGDLGFAEDEYGDNPEECPSKEEYFKSTGLRRLLLAELLRDNAGLFTSQKRKRFLPFESRGDGIGGEYCTSGSQVADFVGSIGDDYGPRVDWLSELSQKYGVWPRPFFA